MRIAVDAMGGDKAPEEVIKGAISACDNDEELEVLLVGRTEKITKLLTHDYPQERLKTVHASEVIGMSESPVRSAKKKKDSSIQKCASLLRQGKADAMVSAGNTGAVVAATSLSLKRLKGVKRPGIGIALPTVDGVCVVIDVGANIRCKPLHMLQYAVMGSVYSQSITKKDSPEIGLLNIGQESAKGNDLVRKTLVLFQKSSLNFKGNIEGQDIFKGLCDVVVCEGFVGNVILKVSEGLAESLLEIIFKNVKEMGKKEHLSKMKGYFAKVKEVTDYSEYGGAPLLGINGVCIICHGRSDARAIENGIREAKRFFENKINDEITNQIQQSYSYFRKLGEFFRYHSEE